MTKARTLRPRILNKDPLRVMGNLLRKKARKEGIPIYDIKMSPPEWNLILPKNGPKVRPEVTTIKLSDSEKALLKLILNCEISRMKRFAIKRYDDPKAMDENIEKVNDLLMRCR
jgi:hypothetical protein